MLTSYTDLKDMILEEWDSLDRDNLDQLVDSVMPVYYSDIAKQWQEMPSEWDNTWRDIYGQEIPANATIYSLMEVDLWQYYQNEISRIYGEIAEIKQELEEA
jgi:hypothetical protein